MVNYMNCPRCNCEMPDTAEKCPVCGFKSSNSAVKKCAVCGLMLEAGAVECPVCGTPAANAGDAEHLNNAVELDVDLAAPVVQPLDFSEAPAQESPFPEPIFGGVSAEPVIPQASELGGAAPAQESTFAEPFFGGVSAEPVIPQTSEPGGAAPAQESTFAEPFFGGVSAEPVIPQTSEPGGAAPAQESPFPEPSALPPYNANTQIPPYGAGNAARQIDLTAMTTLKPVKKNTAKTAAIAICAIAVIAIIIGIFLPFAISSGLFLSKEKYALKAEEAQVNALLELTDSQEIISSINSAAVLSQADTTDDGTPVLDAAALAEAVYYNVKGKYGTDALYTVIDPSIQLTDTAKSLLNGYDPKEISDTVQKCRTSFLLKSDRDIFSVEADFGGTELLLTVDRNGAAYAQFPQYSDSALMLNFEQPKSAPNYGSELTHMVKDLGFAYLRYYEDAEIAVEKSEEYKGKVITAKITGDNYRVMLNHFAKILKDNDGFVELGTDYCKQLGICDSKDAFRRMINKAVEAATEQNEGLIIRTVVGKNNTIYEKSVEVIGGDNAAVFFKNAKNSAAFSVSRGDAPVIDISADKEAGKADVKLYGDKGCVSLAVQYAFEVKQFCGKDIPTGYAEISLASPEGFEELSDYISDEVYSALSTATLAVYSDTDGKAISTSIAVSMPQYGSAKLEITTAAQSAGEIMPPENTIDVLSADGKDKAERVMQEVYEGLAKSDSLLGEILSQSDFGGEISEERQAELLSLINSAIDKAYEIPLHYRYVITDEQEASVGAITESLNEYRQTVSEGVSAAQATEIEDAVNAAAAELSALEKTLKRQAGDEPLGYDPFALPEYDYDNLSFDELIDAGFNLEMRYYDILVNQYDRISENEKLLAQYDECADEYEKFTKSFDKLYDAVSRGNASVPLLRDARKATKKFDESLRSLINALGQESA